MTKRIILVCGWGGSPESDWYPWFKEEFEKRGYEVLIPRMPETDYPKIEKWIPQLAEVVGEVDESTYLIGHSIGSQTIIRFLETLPEGRGVGKVIFVAGWFTLTGLEQEEIEVASPWLNTPIDFEKAKTKASSFVALFSDNDPHVPLEENSQVFKEKLGAQIIIEKDKGHFNEEARVTELPILLKHL